MIKQFIQVGIWCITLSIGISGYSQIKKEKQADRNFDRLAYVDAIQIYEKIVNKGYVNTSVLQNLADAYYFNGKLVEANKWYTELFEGSYDDKNLSILPSEYYYRYGQTLRAIQDYDKAQQLMNQFTAIEKEDTRGMLYNKNRDYLAYIDNHSDRYDIKQLPFNTSYSDYGGTIYGDYFVFTSARETEQHRKRERDVWTNQSYTKLYMTKINHKEFEEINIFAPELSSKVNDATAVFTKDGNTMYFTRNNFKTNGKSEQNKEQNSFLKLYKAIKQSNDQWGQVEELPFNSDNFNTAHPALSPNEKWLYFVSDRKGTIGESDLYRVALFENGDYGSVENLGKQINTEGRETFPFISSDYQLYFASDGHPGLGGLDVFVSKIYPDGSLGPVINMGRPINSSLDDFGFYFDSQEGKGFVSSNRAGGKGSDDIYFIVEKPCKQILEGIVYDKNTQEVIKDAYVTITDGFYQQIDTLYTDVKGFYRLINLGCDNKYRIKVEKASYNVVEKTLNANRTDGVKTINIGLEKRKTSITDNDDLFKQLNLQPIYFDFDKDNIRRDAAIELMKVVEVLKEYPTMRIDVRSHTDSRGSDAYNMDLSDRRVKSTIRWMIEQGIDPSRLTGRGYGESYPLNKCDNDVYCSEADYQINRRSEFIIIAM